MLWIALRGVHGLCRSVLGHASAPGHIVKGVLLHEEAALGITCLRDSRIPRWPAIQSITQKPPRRPCYPVPTPAPTFRRELHGHRPHASPPSMAPTRIRTAADRLQPPETPTYQSRL